MFALVAAYIVVVAGYLIWHHNLLSPDQFFLLALLVTLVLGRARAFLLDWVPLIALLFGYEYVRGLVPILNDRVHLEPMIQFDRLLFGAVPTVSLQARYFNPGSPHWYDYAAVCLYLLHFVVPLAAGFLFWVHDRRMFREYAVGILLLSYLAYLTYLLYPAAPPWMAAQVGSIGDVRKILDVTFSEFRDPIYLPSLYYKLGVNQVAAVPSLHAAYPMLVALFVGEKLPKMIPFLAAYVLSVWMAIVYLGEHYAFDVFLGAIYAVVSYGLVAYWPAIQSRLSRHRPAIEEVPHALVSK